MNTYRAARNAMTAPYQAFRQTLRIVIPLAWRRFLVRLVRGEQLSPEEMYWAKAARIITPLSLAGPARCDVICFPVIDWDFRFQRPQQLMIQFAAAGHRVFYLSQHFRRSGPLYLLREKRRNLYEVSLRGLPRSIYTEFLDHQACEALFAALDQMRGEQSLSAAAIVQLPFWWPLAERTRACFAWPIIYDCMDHHAGFSLNRPEMLSAEEHLLSEADSVIVSSLFLEREARKRNQQVVMARNGCDYEHFAQVAPSLSPTFGGRRPVIGYYGAIADWFDADLVADLAERHPDWDFILVGSTQSADLSRLGQAPNITLVGEQPYAKIPEWLNRFDVTLISFKRTPLTEATNPVKAYEILAAGKPLVSTPLPEVVALGPIVKLGANVEEFEREIAGALAENDPALIERRRAFARENTWEKRFAALAPTVSASFPKASIIIVTYNNLALNRQCLESLYQHTEWPNFEVIVVDNASTDGTAEYLREAERTFPNLRVVLNESNRGFAAANNQGLRLAGGEYLALLNNDTAPTRGWLSSLIRHLSADPQIGLIGPVTNEIGNEARVEAGYESLDELPVWALNYTRRHDGQLFSPPMLAMFCVVMRRSVFEKIGTLDERFGVGMFEDDDYARRLREQGYKLVCARDAFVHHAGSASFKKLSQESYRALFEQNRKLYEDKWGEVWQPHEDSATQRHVPSLLEQMRQILRESGEAARDVILFLPWRGWGHAWPQRARHLAAAMAQQGSLVFFDCSGSSVDDFYGFRSAGENLWLYKGPRGVLDKLERPALWARAHHTAMIERWEKRALIYELPGAPPDDLVAVGEPASRLGRHHRHLLKEADLVVCAAPRVTEALRAERPDCLHLPNGADSGFFPAAGDPVALDPRVSEAIASGHPVAGCYGLGDSLDGYLLMELARRRPDWRFVVVTQSATEATMLEPLASRPNLLIVSAALYEALPHYLAQFTVALLPARAASPEPAPPLLYESLASGKPIVSAPMPECQALAEAHVAHSAEEFAQALDLIKRESRSPAFQSCLRELAQKHSWQARSKMAIDHINAVRRKGR